MSYDNPFASPYAGAGAEPDAGSGPVTPRILQYLRETRPWVLFLSVLGFIGTALIVCMGGIVTLASLVGVGGELEGALGVGLGLFYIAMGAIYLFPSLFMWRYGTGITRLLATEDVAELEGALRHQRSFWRLVGIMTAAILVLYVLIFLGALLWAVVFV